MSIDQNTTTPAPATLTKKQAKKAAKAAKKKALTPGQKKFRNYAVTAVAAYCIGALVSSNASAPEPVAAPEPAPVVETVTETVTETVEVPAEFPSSCGDAYRDAEKALTLYEQVGPLAAEALGAVSTFDQSTLDAKTAQIEDLSTQINASLVTYFGSKYTCEEALDVTLPTGY